MRDYQTSKVYSAEQRFRWIYDNINESQNPVVEVEGVTLTMPVEVKFGSIESVQGYCDKVCDLVDLPHLTVRHRKGDAFAHYSGALQAIAINKDSSWAMREVVVLHELAHHYAWHADIISSPHGPEFVRRFIELLEKVMGPEAGFALRILSHHSEVIV